VRAFILEGSPFAAQCVAGRAAVFLSLFIPVEIVASLRDFQGNIVDLGEDSRVLVRIL
jgi:hypothetical protein